MSENTRRCSAVKTLRTSSLIHAKQTITKDFNDDKHKNTFYVPQQGSTSAQQYHETGPSKQSPEL